MKLGDCKYFSASVEEKNGKFYVIILGSGIYSDCDLIFEIVKKKEFEDKKACMDFLTNQTDLDYDFFVDDFEFASHRYFPIDYFGCGVDFDED